MRLSEKVIHRAKDNAEWIQERVEEAVSTALGKLHFPTKADLAQLTETVVALGKKVDALTKVAEEQVKSEIAELRKNAEKIGKNLSQVDQRVRQLVQARTAKPAHKSAKGSGRAAD